MNVKLVSFACAISFFLSFFIALISGAGFGISILRALIIGACFGALSFGIDFLYEKFLKDENSDNQTSENNSEPVMQPIGNKVDITIADEDLPNDDVSPRFVLTGQNQMLNKGDLSSIESSNFSDSVKEKIEDLEELDAQDSLPIPESEKSAKNSETNQQQEFKPVLLGAKQNELSDEFPDIDNTLGENSILSKNVETAEDEVDAFPEMESSKSILKDDTVTDSEFASAGKPAARLSDPLFPDGSMAESKDSTLMAEAIRTILKKEE